MAEPLVIAERVRNAIALGESHFREFKSAFDQRPGDVKPRRASHICRDIGEALVSFANGDGGDLLIGVEDDGVVTGIPHDAEDVATMLAAPSTHVYRKRTPPLQIATELTLDGKKVLLFSVGKGTRGVYQLPDGRCVRRSGVETIPESVDQILFDQRETRSRTFDSEYVDGAGVADLDLDLVTGLSKRFLTGLTPEKYLQQLGLAEYAAGGLRLRRAALFLFARDITRWHPRSQVRILKVQGPTLKAGTEYNVSNDEYVGESPAAA